MLITKENVKEKFKSNPKGVLYAIKEIKPDTTSSLIEYTIGVATIYFDTINIRDVINNNSIDISPKNGNKFKPEELIEHAINSGYEFHAFRFEREIAEWLGKIITRRAMLKNIMRLKDKGVF